MPRKTKAQKEAARFLELHGIVHYLLTEQRCPVIMPDGKLAFVRCPGVSKEAFKAAIEARVIRNLVDYCKANPPQRTNGGVTCDATDGPCACGAWHDPKA